MRTHQTQVLGWTLGDPEPIPRGLGWEGGPRIGTNNGQVIRSWQRPMPPGLKARLGDLAYRALLGHPDSMRATLFRTARFFVRGVA
jgi:hypothetical protein